MRDYLFDKDFLYKLDQYHHKGLYAKIIALNFDENPIEQIEGRVTGGSINIDGTSSMRRSCSITLVANEVNINDFYWGLNTKFRFEIGVKNDINAKYPDIIWFLQGTFVITNFSTSLSTNSYTINISGKDKMCLLNGEVGGSLPSSIDFGQIDTYEYKYTETEVTESTFKAGEFYVEAGNNKYVLDDINNVYDPNKKYYRQDYVMTRESYPIKDIIREAVHVYGNEPYHNIVINDLDEKGLELMEYRSDKDMYVIFDAAKGDFVNITFNENQKCAVAGSNPPQTITVKEASEDNPLVDGFNDEATHVTFDVNGMSGEYTVGKISFGDTAGYRITDLTYTGDLISNPGESLTSMLDKLVNMLGDFEYFYDIDGRFIFQKKRIYVNTSWNTITSDGYDRYVENAALSSPVTYSFEDSNLVTSFQNTPDLLNLRNDFSVWGKRKGVTGKEIPIHARYAIDQKPHYYKAFNGKIYCTDLSQVRFILEEKYANIINRYRQALDNFQLQYSSATPAALKRPQKLADGSWTEGWWDIRDWASYYKIITNTTQDPQGTMKFYSYNSMEGCIPVADLGNVHLSGFPSNQSTSNLYTWLIIYNRRSDDYNIGHGNGNPISPKKLCYYWEGGPKYEDTVQTDISKEFMYPFAGCHDSHTYLFFLNQVDEYHSVYFYSPKFPGVKSTEEILQESITEEFNEFLNSGAINVVDWREIIYQMALDYYQFNNDIDDTLVANGKVELPYDTYIQDDFLSVLQENNIVEDEYGNKTYLYPGGNTGYEKYYIDMQGFWRDLYNPDVKPEYVYEGGYYETYRDYNGNTPVYEEKTRYVEPYPVGLANDHLLPETYINEIKSVILEGLEKAEAREQDALARDYLNDVGVKVNTVADSNAEAKRDQWIQLWEEYYLNGVYPTIDYLNLRDTILDLTTDTNDLGGMTKSTYTERKTEITNKYQKLKDSLESDVRHWTSNQYAYWNKDVLDYPEKLLFWIDFLDEAGELDQFAIPVIGDRPKVVNDNDVKAIYFRDTPNLIYQTSSSSKSYDFKTGYVYINLPKAYEDFFTISALGKSAKEVIDTLLYNYSYCVENVNLNVIPVYYLEPNTRIYVHDERSGINGEYIVSRISVPLAYNGMMSITATKAAKRLY